MNNNNNNNNNNLTDISCMILNVTQSPEDNRDLIFTSSSEIKLILDYRGELLSVRNQGTQGTCYAFSAACMKEWQEKKDYGLNEYLSPQFFYNNRENLYDENDKNNDGMFGRNVMKLLKEIGICSEQQYPYGLIQTRDKIDSGCYLKAFRNKIVGYAKITTLENMKRSLNKNGPCLISFPVYNYTKQLWKQQDNETMIGGHAMTIVGYLEDCFIIRNSWGPYWGDAGYCYYYFTDWGAHWEAWTTIDNVESDYVPSPPEPEPKDLNNICPKCVIS